MDATGMEITITGDQQPTAMEFTSRDQQEVTDMEITSAGINKRRGGSGRKKIEIKKIINKDYLKSTFSKRRGGLFRKVKQFHDLYGNDTDTAIAAITFSPGDKPITTGYPSVDSVVDRYLAHQASRKDRVNNNNSGFLEDKKEGEECEGKLPWWETPVDSVDVDQVLPFKAALDRLICNIKVWLFEKEFLDAN